MQSTVVALFLVTLASSASPSGTTQEALPVHFDTGRRRIAFEQTAVHHLGTGRVTHAASAKDILAVAADRRYRGEGKDPVGLSTAGGSSLYAPPRTRWFSLNAVDIYRIGKDDELAFITRVPLQHRVRLLQFGSRNQLLVGDSVGVTAYGIDLRLRKGG